MNPVTAARVHVALRVCVDAIRKADRAVGEDLAVMQALAVESDVEAVDGGRVGEVVFVGECVRAGVCYVDVLEIGATVVLAYASGWKAGTRMIARSAHWYQQELLCIAVRRFTVYVSEKLVYTELRVDQNS